LAHPSFPWQDEALAIATHKANVWIDLSGWSPKYFPENLVRYARTLLQDKVLFGEEADLLLRDGAVLTEAEVAPGQLGQVGEVDGRCHVLFF
ncbi:amidohydrolase family protein, partial [Rhizobium johnstonii]|uniref:amidohydrolase family protein n=1 Tax=Rhizobium johnstonii TaxID=3019933 RepID=UPI003F9AB07D